MCERPRESKIQKNLLLLLPPRLALFSCSPIDGNFLPALEERWLPPVPWRKLPSPGLEVFPFSHGVLDQIDDVATRDHFPLVNEFSLVVPPHVGTRFDLVDQEFLFSLHGLGYAVVDFSFRVVESRGVGVVNRVGSWVSVVGSHVGSRWKVAPLPLSRGVNG